MLITNPDKNSESLNSEEAPAKLAYNVVPYPYIEEYAALVYS